ncbi:PTS transporter subunit EIIC [Streptomyces sp. NPDC100445]|uniref:PTS transporter subunit EIIC n=1 Tax=Streptomyces sp. NPDC100445 TaxID=3366102 RepID=UPI003801DE59
MRNDPASTATAVLARVGGPANVASVTHCVTRLRLTLADPAAGDEEALRAVPGVLGVVSGGDVWQVVLGPGVVDEVTAEVRKLLAGRDAETADAGRAAGTAPAAEAGRGRDATPVRTALRRVAHVFVPLIPALIGCGVLAGLNGLLLNAGLLPALTPALAAVASAFMALIPVFVGYNTAREFGGTPVLGGAVAAVVVYPGVAQVTAFGVHLAPGQGGVLGALAAAFLATRVEKWCRGRVPGALDVLLTPTVTVLVVGLVTLYGLMYAAGTVATAIGTAATWLLATTGALAGLLLGGLFLPLVMLGLHQALIPLHATLIEQQGYTALLPLLAMAGAGQVGAALAVYVRLRHDVPLRTTIRSALPAGLLGVGEPLIYGVSLPLGRPFLTACAGGAAGGAFIGFFAMLGTRVGATAIGPSGWALFPLLAGNRGPAVLAAIYGGGLLTGYLVGFLATYATFRPPVPVTATATATPAGDPGPRHLTGPPER